MALRLNVLVVPLAVPWIPVMNAQAVAGSTARSAAMRIMTGHPFLSFSFISLLLFRV
jgi:hypothetical protein